MRLAATVLLLSAATAHAETSKTADYTFLSSFLQMIASLAIVVGLIFLTWYVAGKLFKGMPVSGNSPSKNIRIIETRYLGPKKALLLVEVGGEYLLLSSTDSTLNLIKKINMLEEIEVVEKPDGDTAGFIGFLNRCMKR